MDFDVLMFKSTDDDDDETLMQQQHALFLDYTLFIRESERERERAHERDIKFRIIADELHLILS